MSETTGTPRYYVPEGSPWPIVGGIGLFITALGGAMFIQESTARYAKEGSMGALGRATGRIFELDQSFESTGSRLHLGRRIGCVPRQQ